MGCSDRWLTDPSFNEITALRALLELLTRKGGGVWQRNCVLKLGYVVGCYQGWKRQKAGRPAASLRMLAENPLNVSRRR